VQPQGLGAGAADPARPAGRDEDGLTTSRAACAVGALLLALAWTVAAARPAAAVAALQIASPREGAVVTGPTALTVTVDTDLVETAEAVDARLTRGGSQVGGVQPLRYAGGEVTGGRSSWVSSIDPLASWAAGGNALPNGTYRLEVRARSDAETTGWTGQPLVVDAAPPPTSAAVALDGQAVRITWQPVNVPDLLRYTVERGVGQDAFEPLTTLEGGGATAATDAQPPAGSTARYRIVAARAGAGGGERTSTSAPEAVDVPAAEPSPAPTPSAPATAPGTGQADPATGEAAPQPPRRPPPRRAPLPPTQAIVPPAAPPTPEEALPPAALAPPDTFAEELPFADGQPVATGAEAGGELAFAAGDDTELGADGSGLEVIVERTLVPQRVLVPVAGGMILVLCAAHVWRFRSD